MRKYFKLLSIFALLILLTGCVKYNLNMKISEDKKMRMELILATSKSLQSMGTSESTEEKEENKETEEKLKKAGWKVEEYEDDNFSGKKYVKEFDNIDEVSTTDKTTFDANKLVEGENQAYMFYKRVENGKEIYKAVIKADTSEATEGTGEGTKPETTEPAPTEPAPTEPAPTEPETTEPTEGEEVENVEPEVEGDLLNDEQSEAFGQQMLSTMDLKITVEAPNVISSNATTTDGNKLTWDLTKTKEDMEFEFAIPIKNQLTIIPIAIGVGVGVALLIVVIVVVVIIAKGKKGKNEDVAPVVGAPVPTPVAPEPVASPTPEAIPTQEPVVKPEPVVASPEPVVPEQIPAATPEVQMPEPMPAVEQPPVEPAPMVQQEPQEQPTDNNTVNM
jgi:hypothetical protein